MFDSFEVKQRVLKDTGAPGPCTALAMVVGETALLLNAKGEADIVFGEIDEAERITKGGEFE